MSSTHTPTPESTRQPTQDTYPPRYPRYCVDGLEFDDPDSNYTGDGQFPPFVVFDVTRQENLPGHYDTREKAEQALVAHVLQEAMTTLATAGLTIPCHVHLMNSEAAGESFDALCEAVAVGSTARIDKQDASAIQQRRTEIETTLVSHGYRMELDAGAIPGEGHLLLASNGKGQPLDADQVSPTVAALAREWSDLTDHLIELDPDRFEQNGAKP